MSVIRQKRRSSFTVVDNSSINDDRLSLRAKGLHVVLLSKPDHWEFSSERLADECVEGRDAVRSALRELKEAGYVLEVREQTTGGHWVTYTEVWEVPSTLVPVSPGGRKGVEVRPLRAVRGATDRLETRRSVEPYVGGSGDKGTTDEQALRSKATPVARRATPQAKPRASRKLRAVADDEGDLQRTGSLPVDGPEERVVKPMTRPKRGLNPTFLGVIWDDLAESSDLPEQERGATGGLVRNIKTWAAAGVDLKDVQAAMNLFFANPSAHHRGGRRAWVSFVELWPALHAKVTAPDITNTDYYTEHKEQAQWQSMEEYEAHMLRKVGRG